MAPISIFLLVIIVFHDSISKKMLIRVQELNSLLGNVVKDLSHNFLELCCIFFIRMTKIRQLLWYNSKKWAWRHYDEPQQS